MLVEGVKGSGSPIILSPIHEVIQQAFTGARRADGCGHVVQVTLVPAERCQPGGCPERAPVGWRGVAAQGAGPTWGEGPSGGTAVLSGCWKARAQRGHGDCGSVLCEGLLLASWLRVLRQVSCLCLLICEGGGWGSQRTQVGMSSGTQVSTDGQTVGCRVAAVGTPGLMAEVAGSQLGGRGCIAEGPGLWTRVPKAGGQLGAVSLMMV